MKLYVTYVILGIHVSEPDRHRSRSIKWEGSWEWTEPNLSKVRRALANANLKSSRIVVEGVQEMKG